MKCLLFAFIAFASIATAGEPDKDLHNKCLYPTVFIASERDTAVGSGSGVIVESEYNEGSKKWDNVVFSSAHVIESDSESDERIRGLNNAKYTITLAQFRDWSTLKGYLQFDAHLRMINHSKDICILKFQSDEKLPTAEIDLKSKLYIGSDVIKVGYGLRDYIRVDFGKITSLASAEDPGTIRISAATVPGDSGGPVFHEYKLIGLMKSVKTLKDDNNGDVDLVYQIAYAVSIKEFDKKDLPIEKE